MATVTKGPITSTPFADAIASPQGLSSPAPAQNNKSGKK